MTDWMLLLPEPLGPGTCAVLALARSCDFQLLAGACWSANYLFLSAHEVLLVAAL